MKINHPVTQTEVEMADGMVLVSTTDPQGRITHCNRAFVQMSGFSYDELLGQPHNLVRHPDMPPEAYADMWSTIGRGRPWSGIVKNRCKNGDFYWVQANVSPVMEGGKPTGYMSVRLKPTREQVRQAEQLYRDMAEEKASARGWPPGRPWCWPCGGARPWRRGSLASACRCWPGKAFALSWPGLGFRPGLCTARRSRWLRPPTWPATWPPATSTACSITTRPTRSVRSSASCGW